MVLVGAGRKPAFRGRLHTRCPQDVNRCRVEGRNFPLRGFTYILCRGHRKMGSVYFRVCFMYMSSSKAGPGTLPSCYWKAISIFLACSRSTRLQCEIYSLLPPSFKSRRKYTLLHLGTGSQFIFTVSDRGMKPTASCHCLHAGWATHGSVG